jgi:hypothetical protein
MKTLNSVKKLALCAALGGLSVWQASATVVYDQPVGLLGNDQSGNSQYYEVGNEFQVNTPGIVSAIGMFNPILAGFGSATISVAIFQDVGGTWTIVPNTLTYFTGTPAGTFSGASLMQSIAPVTLDAGIYAIVAGGGGTVANGYWNYSQPGPGALSQTFNTVGGALSQINQAQWAFSGSADPTLTQWPIEGGGGANGVFMSPYGAGNMDFTPVPEAAGFALAGVAMLGLVYAGRAYSQKLKVA